MGLEPAEFRKAVFVALLQVRYDRPVKKREDPVYTKSLRQYLPSGITKLDLLNAVRFLRTHNIIHRVDNYGWQTSLSEQDIPKFCFQHGKPKPCKRCEMKG